MSRYEIAKAHHQELLREAAQARLIKKAVRAQRETHQRTRSQAQARTNQHLRTAHA